MSSKGSAPSNSEPLNQLKHPLLSALSRREALTKGALITSPIFVGIIPFALMAGICNAKYGLDLFHSSMVTLIIYAGAAHIATIELLKSGVHWSLAALTGILINIRLMVYSLSLSPELKLQKTSRKLTASYFLTDQIYAVCMHRFQQLKDHEYRYWFYLGGAISLFLVWVAGSLTGTLLGVSVPPQWHLEFAIPLTFLCLLMPHLKKANNFKVALTSGLLAVWWMPIFPYRAGLISAIFAGLCLGIFLNRQQSQDEAYRDE